MSSNQIKVDQSHASAVSRAIRSKIGNQCRVSGCSAGVYVTFPRVNRLRVTTALDEIGYLYRPATQWVDKGMDGVMVWAKTG